MLAAAAARPVRGRPAFAQATVSRERCREGLGRPEGSARQARRRHAGRQARVQADAGAAQLRRAHPAHRAGERGAAGGGRREDAGSPRST